MLFFNIFFSCVRSWRPSFFFVWKERLSPRKRYAGGSFFLSFLCENTRLSRIFFPWGSLFFWNVLKKLASGNHCDFSQKQRLIVGMYVQGSFSNLNSYKKNFIPLLVIWTFKRDRYFFPKVSLWRSFQESPPPISTRPKALTTPALLTFCFKKTAWYFKRLTMHFF